VLAKMYLYGRCARRGDMKGRRKLALLSVVRSFLFLFEICLAARFCFTLTSSLAKSVFLSLPPSLLPSLPRSKGRRKLALLKMRVSSSFWALLLCALLSYRYIFTSGTSLPPSLPPSLPTFLSGIPRLDLTYRRYFLSPHPPSLPPSLLPSLPSSLPATSTTACSTPPSPKK